MLLNIVQCRESPQQPVVKKKKKKATAERPALEVKPTHAEDPGNLLKLTDCLKVLTEKKKKMCSWDHLFWEELGENLQNCDQKKCLFF